MTADGWFAVAMIAVSAFLGCCVSAAIYWIQGSVGCGMTADGWLSEPNGEGWYWIEGYVSAGPKYVRHLGRDWYWIGADQAMALGRRRVYPVIDVPKEIAR